MKQDFFAINNIKHIDYKDVDILRKFINPSGRIVGRKRSGVIAKHQRKLDTAIKRARFMGLLPFIVK